MPELRTALHKEIFPEQPHTDRVRKGAQILLQSLSVQDENKGKFEEAPDQTRRTKRGPDSVIVGEKLRLQRQCGKYRLS